MKKIIVVAIALLLLTAGGLHAQQKKINQVENKQENTMTTAVKTNVRFLSNGMNIAGILFRPAQESRYPAIVITHPAGGVKEQTASVYAERLARMGFAALVFDAAYQGESTGEPRGLEDPFQRAEDIRAAVSFLSARSDVDAKRIGALGICAGSGYTAYAAQTDLRIKAVATVSGVDVASALFEDPEMRNALLVQAGEYRNAEARGEGAFAENHLPATKAEADQNPPRSMYGEGYYYYRTSRGAHPRASGWGVIRMDVFAQFSPFAHNDWISPRPLLMIAGTDADTRHYSEDAIKLAKEPKELYLVKGASHVDLYDTDPYVQQAVEKLADFFGKNLQIK